MTDNSNRNAEIKLSRNTPVALVCGAASFLGSHLVDKLLQKNLQVIGVDDLDHGKKENLRVASEDKNFHFLIESLEKLDLDINRLDYIFVIPNKDSKINKILTIFRKLKPRLLLISSILLYDKSEDDLKWLKKIESEIAKEAKDNNLNARILRLGSVYGPRMNFDDQDPVIRLIQQSLLGDLQKEISLDFSSRALFIDDAADLAVKCIFVGSTAQKIFDGVLPAPIKVAEIKQILLDPVWYENKHFVPTELPPWPTPNLEKTEKLLNFHAKADLVSHLKQTLAYFKDNEIVVPKIEAKEVREEKIEEGGWKMDKAEELEGLKRIGESKEQKQETRTEKKGSGVPKLSGLFGKFVSLTVVLFIMYALIWPIAQMSWGVLSFRYQLLSAANSLQKGQFEESLFSINQAKTGVSQAKSIYYSLEPIRGLGIFKEQFEIGDSLSDLATLSSDAAYNTILGVQSLYQSLKSITGELNQSSGGNFDSANVYLSSADQKLSKAQALINNPDFKSRTPGLIKSRIYSLSERLKIYSDLVKSSRALSILLPNVVAMEGSKSYLILLQNNNELRPTGGVIDSYAYLSFENGKLKNLEAKDVSYLDSQLKIHVEPPKEIKSDLNQKDYLLQDANWEPDFPTSARQISWFYTKETNQRVAGIVAMDISAIEDLLKVIGPLDLPDLKERITADNLFEKSVHGKKTFSTALISALFNKLFFLPNQNWPGISASLGRSLAEKHMSVYLDDSTLFSYVVSQKWAGILPRADKETSTDFLSVVEANLGLNKANFYLDRETKLETVIATDGGISHRLRIAYTNRSTSEVFPGGLYKNRIRIYLPFGSKLTKALWGEADILKDVTGFIDYGRSGYSLLIELSPKEQKTLVLDYQTPLKLDFSGKAIYRLDVVKQAGTLKDPFVWEVNYPLGIKLSSSSNSQISPQQYLVKTELSEDKTFQLEFIRP